MEPGTDKHHKQVQMLKQQITSLNNEQQWAIYMQETYEEC